MAKNYYRPEDQPKFIERIEQLQKQSEALAEDFATHTFATQKGKEYAQHGFSRRRNVLWRCVRNTFDLIPPNLEGRPKKDDVTDATISLHTFYVNIFGACDNLAWVLVHEKDIRKPDGGRLPAKLVGLRKGNKEIRQKLSDQLIAKLDDFGVWLKHIDNFRHSLAHRIPLYVPPFTVLSKNEEDYHRLEQEAWEALVAGRLEENKRLRKEQELLTTFQPVFTHSFSENSPQVVIHPQLLSDFGACLEIGEAVLAELRV